jgi:hypothetical protein
MSDKTPDLPADNESTPSEATTPRRVEREPVQVQSAHPRWLAPAALVLAVIAAGLAAWSLIGQSESSSSEALPGDPKTRVCTAFNTISTAIPLQTNLNLGPDPVAQAAVAGNARLALFGGGVYLLNSLDSNVPSDLADPVRSFAYDLEDIGMNALAGAVNTDPEQSARLANADETRQQIAALCE